VTGGGYNYALGSYGSYSGALGASAATGYGGYSYGGKNLTNRLSLDWTPRPRLQIGLQLDQSGGYGDYQFNSTRNDMSLVFSWQPKERYQIQGSYGIQHVAYNSGYGSSDGSTLMLSFQGNPFGGKLRTLASVQRFVTNSSVNFSGTSLATTTTPTVSNTVQDSLSLRLEYPLVRRETLFAETLLSDVAGTLGSTELDYRLGVDFALTQVLKFEVGWQFIDRENKDPTEVEYNYKANSLVAEMGLRY